MLKPTIQLLMLLLFITTACNRNAEGTKTQTSFSETDTVLTNRISHRAITKTNNRKFIRTADCKFKTADVITVADEINNIVTGNGGFITSEKTKSSREIMN